MLVLVALFVTLIQALGVRTRLVIVDAAFVGASLCAVLACGWAAWRSAGRRRAAWGLFCLTALLWSAAHVISFSVELQTANASVPWAYDALLLASLGASALALLIFPAGPLTDKARTKSLLDAIVVGGAVWFTSRALAPAVESDAGGNWLSAGLLQYPIDDIVLVVLAFALLNRAPTGARLQLGLLCSGFVVYCGADSVDVYLANSRSAALAAVGNLAWVSGYLLVALAALAPSSTDQPSSDRHPGGSASFSSALVYGAFLVAILAAVAHPAPQESPQLVISGILVVISLGVRQLLLALENDRLRRGLEDAVVVRTAELGRVSRRSDSILDSVADGMFGVDFDGRLIFINPAGSRLLGYPADMLIGRRGHDIFHGTRPDGTAYPWDESPVAEALRAGTVAHVSDEVYLRGDGTTFPVEFTVSPIVADGRMEGAVVAFRDISQRREVERLKDEFISVVSHELRTPLTSIRGSLGLLAGGAMGELPARANRMVAIASDSCDRLTRLINDMLDVERISSGAVPMQPADWEAADLIAKAVAETRQFADGGGIRLVVDQVEGAVHADADRVIQTLTNLVSNAAKFSPAGATVTIGAEGQDGQVLFKVADQGRGIPPEKLDLIFERFKQVDSSDARDKGGTGLGLAICQSIVQRHGGRIWVDSELGEGSVFQFTLPAAAERIPLHRSDEDPAGRPTAVVCDDDHQVLAVIGELLDHDGYRIESFERAEDAIKSAIDRPPDVIVMDLLLPGMSGWQAIAELKRNPRTRDVPVVVLSALTSREHPELATWAAGWITKPGDQASITAAVDEAVHTHDRCASVLIVEDDDSLANVLVTTFQQHGLEVRRAATESEAITMSRQTPPEILILDLELPDGDGFDLVETLRRDERLASVPVVVYSASEVDPADRARLRLGPTEFHTKGRVAPVDLERRVVALIRRLGANKASVEKASVEKASVEKASVEKASVEEVAGHGAATRTGR
jgi:PAS domain S-box-containing protein